MRRSLLSFLLRWQRSKDFDDTVKLLLWSIRLLPTNFMHRREKRSTPCMAFSYALYAATIRPPQRWRLTVIRFASTSTGGLPSPRAALRHAKACVFARYLLCMWKKRFPAMPWSISALGAVWCYHGTLLGDPLGE